MMYEIIGKIVLYIIGTSLFGAFISCLDDDGDDWSMREKINMIEMIINMLVMPTEKPAIKPWNGRKGEIK